MIAAEKTELEFSETKPVLLTTRLFLIFVLTGIILSISLALALDIHNRVVRGEKAQDAMVILNSMRHPLYRLKDSPFLLLGSDDLGDAVSNFNETLTEADGLIDRYVELYECTPELYDCASKLKADYDKWSSHARHILTHFTRLLKDGKVGLDDYSHFIDELSTSSTGFVNLMKHFEEGEVILHKDMDDGHRANHTLLWMLFIFIIYNTILLVLFQRSKEALRIDSLKKEVKERKEAEEMARDSQKQLRQLANHRQSIHENERAGIARDIHDELGQILTALNFELSFMSKDFPKEKEMLDEKSKKVSALVNDAIEAVQRISSELHPRILDDLGLTAAIEWYVRKYQERTGMECKLTFDPKEISMDKELNIAIYMAIQEYLTNVARHAEATMVNISLCIKDNDLLLKVIDNGKGISYEKSHSSESFCLLSVKERFITFGGKVKVEEIKGLGTTVKITVPVE